MSVKRERLTVAEFCAEMRITRSTFYDWLAKGLAPKCHKLPNRQLRIDRADVDTWYSGREVAA
jgi:excisionase family DNA binding protein